MTKRKQNEKIFLVAGGADAIQREAERGLARLVRAGSYQEVARVLGGRYKLDPLKGHCMEIPASLFKSLGKPKNRQTQWWVYQKGDFQVLQSGIKPEDYLLAIWEGQFLKDETT